MENGFKQAAGFGLPRGELRLQLIAQGHQLIDLGDDAVLLGERRHWKQKLAEVSD